MKFKKLLIFIISASILFTACDSKDEKIKVQKNIEKKKSKELILTTQSLPTLTVQKSNDGIIFKELKEKIVLLNFFATWCPPCKAEIPHLINLKNRYKDNFEIVAINLGQRDGTMTSNEKIKNFIDEYKINYLVSNVKENFEVSKIMGDIKTIPTMFLLAPSGKIVQKYIGIVPEEMIETDIKKILEK